MDRNRVVAFAVLAALACSGSTDAGDSSLPTSLTLAATQVTTYPGATVALPRVTAYNSAHQPIAAVVRWTSADTTIARITNDTAVSGVAQGSAVLTATTTTGSASATASADIVQEPVAGIIVIGNTRSIYANDSLLMHAYAVGPANDSLAGTVVTLTALTPALATISSAGMVHIHGVGAARILATAGGFEDTATVYVDARRVARIEVTPMPLSLVVHGAQVALSVRLFDTADEELLEWPFSVTIGDPSIVTGGDLPSTLTFAGNAPGSTVITVASDTATTVVPVTVTAAP
jgi:hypothetical protein